MCNDKSKRGLEFRSNLLIYCLKFGFISFIEKLLEKISTRQQNKIIV